MRSMIGHGSPAGPVHTGRRHFQRIFCLDGVFHIHYPADLTTDFLAVVDRDAVLGIINKHPKLGMVSMGAEFNSPELITQTLDHRAQDVFQLFQFG